MSNALKAQIKQRANFHDPVGEDLLRADFELVVDLKDRNPRVSKGANG